MKQVYFNRVEIRNFLSVGNDSVCVDFNTGLHVITGTNKDKEDRRNGVGKSTIADAIHFSIFGSTIRDLKKENIVNHITNRNCEVSLTFTVVDDGRNQNYKIHRSIEPSFCKLYIDETDKTLDTITNTNQEIERILNINQDIFQNCVIMTLNNTTPFMAKKKVEKRKFIEGIFNLGVFSEMLLQLREEYNDLKKSLDIDTTRLEEISNNVDFCKKQSIQFEADRDKKKINLETKKTNNNAAIELLKKSICSVTKNDIDKIKLSISGVEANINKCNEAHTKLQTNISSLSTEKKLLNENLTKIGTDLSTCPVCLRSINDHDTQTIKVEKYRINSEINAINEKITTNINKNNEIITLRNTLKNSVTKLNTDLSTETTKYSDSLNVQKDISKYNQANIDIDQDILTLSQSNNQFQQAIEKEEKRKVDIQKKVDQTKTTLNKLDVIKFIVSEEGVKSFIVKRILKHFNNKINHYLSKMDANCMCMFNEYFEEEIIDEKGRICSYNNFSGAERKNIDLACLFAFMDIRRMQGNAVYNFSIYDELFDSSLDEKGVELVLDILKERVTTLQECVMVISHRKESVKSATGDIIFLEKVNGITRRVASDSV